MKQEQFQNVNWCNTAGRPAVCKGEKVETLLVSAFFDIGRTKSKVKNMSRSNTTYFEYFNVWARMRNNLIVYTQPDFADDVLKIRDRFGLKDKTKICILENISSIEPGIYSRMKKIEESGEWKKIRMYTSAMSNQALYDYVMLMKYWCMADAVKKLDFEGYVVWMDFGFNHGDVCYFDAHDFEFLWNVELKRGIHLFVRNNPDDKNAIGSLLLQEDCIMGAPIIATSDKCELLWEYCKEAMNALLLIDAIDDDQQLLLMAYKAHRNDFIVHYSNWFLPLKEYGAGHMKVRKNYGIKSRRSMLDIVKNLVAKGYFKMTRDYSHATPYDYGKRMEQYARARKET